MGHKSAEPDVSTDSNVGGRQLVARGTQPHGARSPTPDRHGGGRGDAVMPDSEGRKNELDYCLPQTLIYRSLEQLRGRREVGGHAGFT